MKIIEKIVEATKDKHNHSMPTIAFLGDSVTEGSFRGYDDYTKVYHAKLRKMLYDIIPGANINIINAGIGGTTAPFGAERLERDVLSRNPDLCVVCFGLNDAGGGADNLSKYTDALSSIFERLQKENIEVIFMTPNMICKYYNEKLVEAEYAPIIDGFINVQLSGSMDLYMKSAVELAEKYNVPVCDCYGKWKTMEKYGIDTTKLLINGINHPTEEMHNLFAYSLLETMFS